MLHAKTKADISYIARAGKLQYVYMNLLKRLRNIFYNLSQKMFSVLLFLKTAKMLLFQ